MAYTMRLKFARVLPQTFCGFAEREEIATK